MPRPRSRPARGGFTLLELVLVLLVLGLGVAMVVPSLTHFARGREALDAAGHLLAVIQFAQDRAVATGSPHRVQLATDGGAYWLTARRQGAFAALGSEVGRRFALPAGVTAAWASPSDATRGYAEFEPDGGHDVATIRLTAADGRVVLVGCESPGEPYRLAESSP